MITALESETELADFKLATDDRLYIYAFGQSNMLGAEESGNYTPNALTGADLKGDRTNPSNTFVPDGVGGWTTAEYGKAPFTNNDNNIALTFCREFNLLYPTIEVRIVFVAQGGQAIERWQSGDTKYIETQGIYNQYGTIGNRVDIYPASLVLMHQGEANSSENITVYPPKLEAILAEFQVQEWVDSDYRYICGEIGYQGAINLSLHELVVGNSNRRIAQADGLAKGGGSHFIGIGYENYGKRYLDAFLEMAIDQAPSANRVRPPVPINLTATNIGTDSFTINWQLGAFTGNDIYNGESEASADIVGFEIYSQGGFIPLLIVNDSNATSAVIDFTYAIGQEEIFSVLAIDSYGNRSYWDSTANILRVTRP